MCSIFYFSFFCLSRLLSLSLSLSHSQSLTDGWVRNHSNIVVASELDWVYLYVCTYVCHVCFDLMRSLFVTSFCDPILLSVCLSLSLSPFPSVDNVVAHFSLLFIFLFLMYCRTVIIVIRERERDRFDDRLASVQMYYRLDVCIANRSERRRLSSVLFCFILKRW